MMAAYRDDGPPQLVDQRAASGMSIPPPPGAQHGGQQDFLNAFPGFNNNAGATPRWQTAGLTQMSPLTEGLSNFQSPASQWRQELPPSNSWGPVGGIAGQPQWQDTGANWGGLSSSNSWPSPQHQHNLDGFRSTAWQPPSSPSVSGQPIGDGFFGARTGSPTNPYSDGSAYTSSPYNAGMAPMPRSAPASGGGGFGGYGSAYGGAPLASPPKRAFSLRASKKQKGEDWYPRSEVTYGEFNLATRPRDWTQDFELHPSLMKRVAAPKNRSDIKECPDPVKRSLHPLLLYSASRPPLNMDIRQHDLAGTENTLFPYIHRPHNEIDMFQLATTPAAPFMRLYHPRYPWYIDVHPHNPNGVTVGDVLNALTIHLGRAIETRHYFCEDVLLEDRNAITRAYNMRCGRDPALGQRGILRCDYLGMHNLLRLQGLARGRLGMWELKIAVVD